MSCAKAYKPAHGGYPGTVVTGMQPNDLDPAVGEYVRIRESSAHYLRPGSVARVVAVRESRIAGADFSVRGPSAHPDGREILQFLSRDEFEVLG